MVAGKHLNLWGNYPTLLFYFKNKLKIEYYLHITHNKKKYPNLGDFFPYWHL